MPSFKWILLFAIRVHSLSKSRFLARIHEDLGLEVASPEKRLRIAEVLEELPRNPERWKNSGRRAAEGLIGSVHGWE